MPAAISLSSTASRVFCVTFLAIAQVFTVTRLWIRFSRQYLWWDDAWALLTTILSILLEILSSVQGANTLTPIKIPHNVLVVRYWLFMISFTVVVWCARLSLIFSIIRLIPPLFTLRRISEYVAICFVFACAGNLVPKIYICASSRSWYNQPIPSCKFGFRNHKIAIAELITDLAADITLLVIPLRLLRQISLSGDKRRMLIFVFGASLLTSLISIVHVAFLVGPSKYNALVPIIVQVEVGTALVVANLGVLTPVVYRLIKREKESDDSTPDSHYRSFQSNGDIRMRRVSDLVASGVRLTTGRMVDSTHFASESEGEGKTEQMNISSHLELPSVSDSPVNSSGGTDGR